MKCDFCDAEVDDRDLQCASCKADIRYQCSSCGQFNPVIQEKCPGCGTIHAFKADPGPDPEASSDGPTISVLSLILRLFGLLLGGWGIYVLIKGSAEGALGAVLLVTGCFAIAQISDTTLATAYRLEKLESEFRKRRFRSGR